MMHLSEVVEPPVFEHIEQQLEAEKRVSTEDSTHSSTTSTQPIGHGLVIRRRRTTRRTRPEQVSSVGNVTHTCDTRHDTEQEDATTSKIVEQQHTNVPPTKPGHCTTTPSTFGPVESRGWVLNDRSYFRQIVKLWKRRFDVPELSRVHAGSFNRRMERAKRRLLKWKKDFWTIPDPEIDAWMLVMGRTRAVFDLEAFVTRYGKYIECLSRIRRIVNVRVMADRCPMQKILSQTNREEVDGEQRNIQLNSQTFITTIRK